MGLCEHCGASFAYRLIHNGFNDSSYAYCDRCGATALFGAWATGIPPNTRLGLHGPIPPETEERVRPCACGGRYRGTASPRCPRCREALSAEEATAYLEAEAPGTKGGWTWQRSWAGTYAIVIDGRLAEDPWKDRGAG